MRGEEQNDPPFTHFPPRLLVRLTCAGLPDRVESNPGGVSTVYNTRERVAPLARI